MIGFKCVWTLLEFFTNFSKSIKIYDMRLNVLMLIINIKILNDFDHDLEAHKSAKIYTCRLRFFECY